VRLMDNGIRPTFHLVFLTGSSSAFFIGNNGERPQPFDLSYVDVSVKNGSHFKRAASR